ncbi:MAG: ATP-binding protein [Chloroflexota bacterium]
MKKKRYNEEPVVHRLASREAPSLGAILLLIDDETDRQMLADWLSECQQSQCYEVLIPTSDRALQEDFDLCVIGSRALDRLRARIRARRQREEPLFLPFLLLTSREGVGLAIRDLWRTVDDLVVIPASKLELHARVNVLLRARRLSRRMAEEAVQREQAQADAERHAEELDFTLDAISDGLVIFGPKGDVVRMNQPAELLLGLTEEEARKLPFAERVRREGMMTEEGQPIPIEELPAYRALRGEIVMGYRFMIRRPDGTALHLLTTAAPIRNAQGRVTGAVASLADVTQLVELIRLRDEITSTIAHDIRQPLTIIQGQAQVAERSLAADRLEPAKKSIGAIVTSAQRMNVMIEDLVDSVRLEAGRLELKRQPIDLGNFLRDLLQRSAASMDVGRVKLSVEEGIPRVSADPDRLERIVLNLVSNALKYSDPKTPVDIRASQKDGMALVAVQDRGVGIAPEDLPHIFERYYKPKGPRKKESIGLGLYISRILVEAHGGKAWAESQPGKGSTFYFTLPLVASHLSP